MSVRSVTADDKFIGERIREARMATSMSQEMLGDALGVSFQQIQKYEKGVNRLSSVRLLQIAEATDKLVLFFLPGGDKARRTIEDEPALSKFLTTRDGYEIASKFYKLTPAMRATVVDLIGYLARTA